MRYRRGQQKTNILSMNMLDYAMDRMFLVDLQKQFKRLSKQSIAEDLLNGAVSREALSKALIDQRADLSGARALAIAFTLKQRNNYMVKPKGMDRRLIRQCEINRALELLAKYGVVFDG